LIGGRLLRHPYVHSGSLKVEQRGEEDTIECEDEENDMIDMFQVINSMLLCPRIGRREGRSLTTSTDRCII
jgi:hypothetical protein